jgi:phosphatidylglycerol:prolipoprotein diacylglycerol transferase
MIHPFVDTLDPVALHLGPVEVHWYGVMYLLGFAAVWILGERRRRAGYLPVSANAFSDLLFFGMMGVIVGGRVWYMLSYYRPIDWIWTDPLALFRIWDGGMSFHGGLLGVLVAGFWWSRKQKLHFMDTVDFVAPLVPIGLGLGRLGNFINGELWGKPTHVPWAVMFPGAHNEDLHFVATHPAWDAIWHRYGMLPRHPSELYELFLEGVVMFTVLYLYSRKPRPRYRISGLFALMYGCFRIAVEFVRMPDPQFGHNGQPGYLFGTHWVTMGQVQSVPLVLAGLWLLWLSRRAPTLPRVPRRETDTEDAVNLD